MKLVTYRSSEGPRGAAWVPGGYVDLNRTDPGLPVSLMELVASGSDGLGRAASAAARGEIIPAQNVSLLAPIPEPGKVIGIGLNYADHAAETGAPVPAEPICFNKFSSAVAAHEETIFLPTCSQEVDYEAELVVIIGREGRNIAEHQARSYIAGYTCGNDVSARDWQFRKPGGQWLLGKSFEGFAPFGPALVTADEVPDPGNLQITLRLDGQTMQDSSTNRLIFSVEQIVAYLSIVCRLEPGDVIFTGTPPGVGMARKPSVWLRPGQVTEVEISGLGVLRNRFETESKNR